MDESPTKNKVISTMSDCPICCETYNKSTNAVVTCEYGDCGYVACKNCVRTYLTTTSADPCCMKCNKPYSIAFMYDNLNRSFVSKDYRVHRSQLLLERAVSQLPDAMGEVERRVQVEDKKKDISETNSHIQALQVLLRTQQNELWALWALKNKKKDEALKRKFVMGCPREDCRGFLSSQYKCGLCGYHTCSHCLCVKGPEAVSEHECNPDDVATAEMIKAQTKPCPSCGERISKIEGCDQMWCTSCHTAFSWKTGAIDNGVVHNPHFFQYQRTNQGAAAEQGDRGMGQCNANNMPEYSLMRKIKSVLHHQGTAAKSLGHKVMMFYRLIAHVRAHEVIRYRNKVREESDTIDIRVEYLLKRIDKEKMEKRLYTNDQSRRRNVLILNLFDLIADVGLEWVWGLCNSPASSGEELILLVQEEVNKIEEVYEYCNREWAKISYDHRISVPLVVARNDHMSVEKANLYRLGKALGINNYEGDDFHIWATRLYTSYKKDLYII